MLSVITPAFNEEENLPVLYESLCRTLDQAAIEFEWIIVDDCSSDKTFEVIQSLHEKDPRVRGYRFSRNFGSHQAIRCGFSHYSGDAAVVLAADMQDPPELIPLLLEKMQAGADIVWAVRAKREGERKRTILAANTFYRLMRQATKLNLPPSGTDFFLLRRKVADVIDQCKERNVNIMFLISWSGFKQEEIRYEKKARLHGETGWTFGKKMKLAIDSLVSFSSVPLRFMSTLGISTAFLGLLYAIYVIIFSIFFGTSISGWSSLMVVTLISGGTLMVMSGVLGEYIWRILDETKGRPGYIVDSQTSDASRPDQEKQ